MEINDNFWINDPLILFKNDNYLDFYPNKNMSKTQILNAVTRYAIYLFILLLLFANNYIWLCIPIIIIIMCILFESIDDNKKVIKSKKCQEPTKDNPYMNISVNDMISNPDRLEACDEEDSEIKEKVNENYHNDLYRNANDIYERGNSKRQFYTMPNTKIPNDQKGFAEWLFKTENSCKYDGINCLKYEDERYH